MSRLRSLLTEFVTYYVFNKSSFQYFSRLNSRYFLNFLFSGILALTFKTEDSLFLELCNMTNNPFSFQNPKDFATFGYTSKIVNLPYLINTFLKQTVVG